MFLQPPALEHSKRDQEKCFKEISFCADSIQKCLSEGARADFFRDVLRDVLPGPEGNIEVSSRATSPTRISSKKPRPRRASPDILRGTREASASHRGGASTPHAGERWKRRNLTHVRCLHTSDIEARPFQAAIRRGKARNRRDKVWVGCSSATTAGSAPSVWQEE